MYQFPIGAIIDCFRTDFDDALRQAAELGAKGIQMYATTGEHSPEVMTTAMRREMLDKVKSHGLCFSAICGDFGKGFWDPQENPRLIEGSKRIMEMAKELETNIVTTHIGVVPDDPNHDRYKIMQEACRELAEYADSLDSHFAIETGPETAEVLKSFLDSLGSRGVAVNFDPANLVMVKKDDPVKGVHLLKDYIVHTHAKDGIHVWNKDPEIMYGIKKEATPSPRAGKELPLGQGDVPFPEYLKALDEVGYRGFLTIEREVGDNPAADIRTAADFLRATMKG